MADVKLSASDLSVLRKARECYIATFRRAAKANDGAIAEAFLSQVKVVEEVFAKLGV